MVKACSVDIWDCQQSHYSTNFLDEAMRGLVQIVPDKSGVLVMAKEIISTDAAPAAIGTYSQAVKCGRTVYMSGQIPLIPETMELVSDDFHEQAEQVFKNLAAVAEAAGGSLANAVKLNAYLTDLGNFPIVNEVMAKHVPEPFPARAAVGISELPKGALVEVEGILELD
jgi:reactive intermediate/imine deaminase